MLHLPPQDEYPVFLKGDPAITKGSDWEAYYLDLDKKHLVIAGDPAVFWLTPLTTRQTGKLAAFRYSLGDDPSPDKLWTNSLEAAILTCRMSLRRVDGIMGADGAPYVLPVADGLCDDWLLEHLGPEAVFALAKAVGEISAFPFRVSHTSGV